MKLTKKLTEEIKDWDYIKTMLEASASSPQFGNIELTEENNFKFNTRGTLHTLLIQPFGTGKTTGLITLPKDSYYYTTDFSYPSLVGTITRESDFLLGNITHAAGKIFVVDEIQDIGDKSKVALLELLEHQQHTRSLGFLLNNVPPQKSGKFWNIKYQKDKYGKCSSFTITCKFACIASGVYIPSETQKDKMFISRFSPITVNKDIEDIYNMMAGKRPFRINPKIRDAHFIFPKYLAFLKRHKEIFNLLKFKQFFINRETEGFISRGIGDTVRLAAFYASLKRKVEIDDDCYEKALNFAPTILSNYRIIGLSTAEYKILSLMKREPHLTEQEIGMLVGLQQNTISYHIKQLELKGLI